MNFQAVGNFAGHQVHPTLGLVKVEVGHGGGKSHGEGWAQTQTFWASILSPRLDSPSIQSPVERVATSKPPLSHCLLVPTAWGERAAPGPQRHGDSQRH